MISLEMMRIAIFLTLSLSYGSIHAQDIHDLNAINELQKAYLNYQTKYENLLQARGYSDPYQFIGNNYLAALIHLYYFNKNTSGDRPDNIKLLYYHFDEQDSMKAWLIGKEGVLSYVPHKIDKNDIVDAVNKLRYNLGYTDLVSSRGTKVLSNRESSKIEETVNILSSYLLPGQIFSNIDQQDHIIVIPEHVIGQIPFYLLKPTQDKYLIDHVTISMAPAMMDSVRFMAFMKNELLNHKINFNFKNPLVVGNPSYAPELRLAPLPGAEKEAQEIASYIGTKPVIGEEATLSKLNLRLKQSDFLYLATHGISKSAYALDSSYILLSPDTHNPVGKWTAREIMDFGLSADMAVMSACETGHGQVHEGGTIGLATAFYLAGVDNSVLSYWPIDDLSTLEFMKIYIRKLKEPKYGFPATHLREAILEYKQQNPDPRDWAAFMVYGYPY